MGSREGSVWPVGALKKRGRKKRRMRRVDKVATAFR